MSPIRFLCLGFLDRKSTSRYRSWALLLTLALCATAIPTASAQVIVSDTFSDIVGDNFITGRTLETSVPGGKWLQVTGVSSLRSTVSAGFGDPTPGIYGNHQNASAVSIESMGAYTKSAHLRISADIAPRNASGLNSGAALGFYSATGGQFSQNRFTGLLLDSAGNLRLVQDPNATGFYGTGSTLSTPIAFDGTWDANALRRLTYDIDTTTGEISNISLEGSSANYSFTTNLFSDMATRYAGMHTSSQVPNTFSAFDNFSLMAIPDAPAVPEPATFATWMLGLAGAAGYLWRRRAIAQA